MSVLILSRLRANRSRAAVFRRQPANARRRAYTANSATPRRHRRNGPTGRSDVDGRERLAWRRRSHHRLRGIDEKQDLKPVAERLVFRKPGEVLNLCLPRCPGTQGRKCAARRACSPCCNAGSADRRFRQTHRHLQTPRPTRRATQTRRFCGRLGTRVALAQRTGCCRHTLLAGEVKSPDELEYADFLLTNHPKATEALDLCSARKAGGLPSKNHGARTRDKQATFLHDTTERLGEVDASKRAVRDVDRTGPDSRLP